MISGAADALADPGAQSGDHRRRDPCEQAVRLEGRAGGLQAQCEPSGGAGTAKGDFDGDGIGDLAVGVPGEDIGSVSNAGAVHVIYGTANGLAATGNQFLHQDVAGVNGTPTTGDNFGRSLVAGHFNPDNYSDLAVGVSYENLGGFDNVGVVAVFYGSANGLRTDNDQTWDYQDLPASMTLSAGKHNARWGYSMAWTDFNGDGPGDLAIGVPGADGVLVLFGGSNGLAVLGAQEYVGAVAGEGVGLVLATGDFSGDDTTGDLAVGRPYSDNLYCPESSTDSESCLLSSSYVVRDAGSVLLFRGSEFGIFDDIDEPFTISMLRQYGSNGEAFDHFGWAMAAGDFNADGKDDLAVGVPHEDVENNSQIDGGIVQAYLSSEFSGISSTDRLYPFQLSQQAAVETGDKFGFSLAAADFNGDGREDLAVGVPGEDIGSIGDAGVAQVFPGRSRQSERIDDSGFEVSDSVVWHQGTSGMVGSAEGGDQFGYSVTAWNFGRSAHADLAVGIPYENVFNTQGDDLIDAGAVQLIYGSSTGLVVIGNQQWTQNNVSGDGAEAYDNFGRSLY